jgi:hypothetical protein
MPTYLPPSAVCRDISTSSLPLQNEQKDKPEIETQTKKDSKEINKETNGQE